ncbi:MAG TPA: CPBP family glutamic-type intramembrane protease, partial [Bryobacteraceae bacterium]|nr:CPBP family glutamic-type intramembrane protease [Bryobacteraceae bacterium]
CIAPYLIYSIPTGQFHPIGFVLLFAIASALYGWYRILPVRPVTDLIFLVFAAGVYLSKVFDTIYTSPIEKLSVLGHLMLVHASVSALLAIRGNVNAEFRFLPTRREWLIGLRWFAVLVPASGIALWSVNLARFRPHPHNLAIAIGEFLGILWLVALSEEFVFRGLLQQWIEIWTGKPVIALLLASFCFGCAHLAFHHIFPNWRFAIVAAVFGLCCGLSWRESRSVQASMVTHALGATLYRVFFQ